MRRSSTIRPVRSDGSSPSVCRMCRKVFYEAVAAGRAVSAAAAQAHAALKFAGTEPEEIPELLVRGGIDATKYKFV